MQHKFSIFINIKDVSYPSIQTHSESIDFFLFVNSYEHIYAIFNLIFYIPNWYLNY